MKNRQNLGITSTSLHIVAMVCMLCDHLWATVVPGNDWMTCVGRLAFPIYAFLLVEGYFHTRNLKKYVSRLLLFAVLSEIPFNLAIGSRMFYPIHQNVLWSFLISIGLIHWNETAKQSGKTWKQLAVAGLSILLGYLAGIVTMVDYLHAGILTVLVFYFMREKNWWNRLGQLLCLWYINAEILAGFTYEFFIGGHIFSFARQSFALFALIPIWLYRGEQGCRSKALRYVYYLFYPLHLLILGLIKFL